LLLDGNGVSDPDVRFSHADPWAILRSLRKDFALVDYATSLNLLTRQRSNPDAMRSRRKTVPDPCALIISTFRSNL